MNEPNTGAGIEQDTRKVANIIHIAVIILSHQSLKVASVQQSQWIETQTKIFQTTIIAPVSACGRAKLTQI